MALSKDLREKVKREIGSIKEKPEEDFMALVEQYRKERGYKPSMTEAMQKVMMRNPRAHRQYLAKHNPDNKSLQEDK